MDLSGLTSNYTDYLTSAQSGSISKVEGTLNSTDSTSTDEELMDACKQFESYLLEQVFKEMEKTISFDENEDGESSGLSMFSSDGNALMDYFKDETIADIASSTTDQGGLGIAQMLYESMKRNG